MKNTNLVPFLALAAGGLYLANQSGSKASTAESSKLAFTGDTFADEEALKATLIKIIKSNNIELRTLLRGSDGQKGEKGDTGATGLAGDMVQNYGGSLIKNGAFELGNLEGWANITNHQFIGGVDGNKIALFGESVIENNTPIIVDAESLYRISVKVSVIGAGGIVGVLLKSQNYVIGTNSYFTEGNSQRDVYFGGVGINKFPSLVCTCKVNFSSNTSVTSATISNTIVSKVSKGEAVPHNLPFLPLNQTVLNETTGKVGIFNGTTVDYYM